MPGPEDLPVKEFKLPRRARNDRAGPALRMTLPEPRSPDSENIFGPSVNLRLHTAADCVKISPLSPAYRSGPLTILIGAISEIRPLRNVKL